MKINGKQSFTLALILITIFITYAMLKYSKRSHIHHVDQDINTLLIGTSGEYPPFTFIKNKEILGFDIDLIQEIAHRLGKNISFQKLSFNKLIPALKKGTIHLAATGITETPERKEELLFTYPYIHDDPLVIISLKKNPPITSLDDLKNKEVIVNDRYTSDLKMSKVKGIIFERADTVIDALEDLKKEKSTAFVVAQSVMDYYFNNGYNKNNFNIYVIPKVSDQYAFAVSEDYPALSNAINCILEEMKHDGSLESLKRKWKL